MLNPMSAAEWEQDEEVAVEPRMLDVRTPGWDRFVAVAKALVVGGFTFWLVLQIVLAISLPKLRRDARRDLATVLAVPAAITIATRRYLTQYYRLAADGEAIMLRSPLRTISLEPASVQGVIGGGGLAMNAGESVVWKNVVIVAAGRRYTLSFDILTNGIVYYRLRELCLNAWGVPFQGGLETPKGGPELEPEEYAEGLRQVRRVCLLDTQKGIFTGFLIVCGAVAAGIAMALHFRGIGARGAKVFLWIVIIGFIGLVMMVRALKQIPLLMSIRKVEVRLRETY
jgi:hypothetical protein